MKNCVKLLAVLCIGVFAGLLVKGIPIALEVSAGGIERPAGGQNGDVNGDTRLDITDAIFILRHLFSGGEAPVACADSPEIWERVENIEGEVGSLGAALAMASRSLEAISYPAKKIRHDRWCVNGDGTVTDNLTGLMWQQKTAIENFDGGGFRRFQNWEDARLFVEQMDLAGHENWRLPTTSELATLLDFPSLFFVADYECSYWYWTSQTADQVPDWESLHNAALAMRFKSNCDDEYPGRFRWLRRDMEGEGGGAGGGRTFYVLAVRDIDPEE